MRSYILLRNNRESGPYSLRELKTIGINSTDLIWVEGESTAWNHPADFDELKPLVATGILIPLQESPAPAREIQEIASSYTATSFTQNNSANAPDDIDYSQFLEDKNEDFHWAPTKKRKILQDATSGFFGLGVLLIGVMMCAFVVQKLVDHFEFEPYVASAQAIEISRESLPVSTSANAAKSVAQLNTVSSTQSVTPTEEILPVATSAVSKPIEVKKKEVLDTPKAAPAIANAAMVSSESPEQNEEPVPKEEKKEAPAEKKAPTLAVSANDYKVGMFGGISNLELTINNPSAVAVNRATIEVEFLKPNGSVVKSEVLSVENISAGGTKKVQVPSSGRGVKINYRVVNVDVQ